MAWLFGEKKFGQYTYEHWFDNEQLKTEGEPIKAETTRDPCNTIPDTPSRRQEPSCHSPCSRYSQQFPQTDQ
jgi:hypothetical protein